MVNGWFTVESVPSAELALKMHLREPQQREHEAPGTEPEHDDDYLPQPKIPLSGSKVCGDRRHQVNVSNNCHRKQRQHENGAKVSSDSRTEQREPADLGHEQRHEPGPPSSKYWLVRSEEHGEIELGS